MSEPTPDVWKNIAMFLSGVVLALAGAWFTSQRNAVTRDDLPTLMQPYKMEMDAIEGRQKVSHDERVAQDAKLEGIQIQLAKISERLGIDEDSSVKKPRK